MRLYTDLAEWWPLLSPPEDYADEAAKLGAIIADAGIGDGARVLELGSGGGHLAYHWRDRFDLTLVDQAEAMLAQSRRLNPTARHLLGDMRTIRLRETFDVVLIFDAIDHLVGAADLAAALTTAAMHCRSGGVALFCPDHVEEAFADSVDTGGTNGPDGRGIRYLQWCFRAPDGVGWRGEMAYLLRAADGTVSSAHDSAVFGLFPKAHWLAAIHAAGFAEATDHSVSDRTIFVARR